MRRALLSTLNDTRSWNSTATSTANNQAAGPRLNCLPIMTPPYAQAGHPCTVNGADKSAGGVAITDRLIEKVLDQTGGVVLDSSEPNFGISPQGTKCENFSATVGSGSNACPFRFEVLWSAKCGASCVNPQVSLKLNVLYNPRTRFAFNPANYGIPEFLQGQSAAPTGFSTCRTVSAPFYGGPLGMPGSGPSATANCASDETVVSGGYTATSSYGNASGGCAANYPSGNGWVAGHCVDAGGNGMGGTAFARCCK